MLEGINAAAAAGFAPLKLNAVIRRNWNEADVEGLASFARDGGHTMRFIEYMDVGDTNGWRLDDVVPAAEIVDRVATVWPLEPIPPGYPGEVANRYRYLDGFGEVGVISSISQPFCGACTRARLSAIGEVYTCLFASTGHDLRALLRSGGSADATSMRRSPGLDGAGRPLLRTARRPRLARGAAQGRDVLHRRLIGARVAGAPSVKI